MIQARSTIRVRYKETDAMGIAHHSNYVVWLEIGRVDFLTAAGFPYRDVEKRGVLLVVTSLGLKSRLVRFEYALERVSDNALLAEAFTEHIATDLDKRAIPIPQFLRDLLEP